LLGPLCQIEEFKLFFVSNKSFHHKDFNFKKNKEENEDNDDDDDETKETTTIFQIRSTSCG
jgi:hypothetical protein